MAYVLVRSQMLRAKEQKWRAAHTRKEEVRARNSRFIAAEQLLKLKECASVATASPAEVATASPAEVATASPAEVATASPAAVDLLSPEDLSDLMSVDMDELEDPLPAFDAVLRSSNMLPQHAPTASALAKTPAKTPSIAFPAIGSGISFGVPPTHCPVCENRATLPATPSFDMDRSCCQRCTFSIKMAYLDVCKSDRASAAYLMRRAQELGASMDKIREAAHAKTKIHLSPTVLSRIHSQ